MSKATDKKNIAMAIRQAACAYKAELVGKTFMYIFEGRAIEVVYRAKDFLHLTGVDTTLSANDFYKDAIRNRLTHQQFFFSQRHPYDLCKRKMLQLANLQSVTNSAIFILEGVSTNSFTFKFGLTDLVFTVCLGRDTNAQGKVVSNYYVARSLRVEDSFSRGSNAFEVNCILRKNNDEKMYATIMYKDKRLNLSEVPQNILDQIDERLLRKELQNL